MAASNSKVDICNLAMDQLSQEAIVTSIDSPVTREEKICARWYDDTRRALLRAYVWNFAKTRAELPKDASFTPAFGYDNAYVLPADFLRLCTKGDDSIKDYDFRYQMEDGRILTSNDTSDDADSIKVVYIRDEETVTKFDTLFIEVFAIKLALNMAYAFTLKNTKIAELKERLSEAKATAASIDGQERPPTKIQRSKFNQARRSFRALNVAGPNMYF